MEYPSNAYIIAKMEDLKQDTQEIKDHLATLNGRTRKAEIGVAIQWVLWAIVGAIGAAFLPFIFEKFL